jgi:regulator of nonsense transcripts 3
LRVDEDFISFLESLKGPANTEHVTLESLSKLFRCDAEYHLIAEHLVASTQPVPQPKSTPLLEALKAEKSANKDKEAILRNHAHYNHIIPPVSRKEDKKKNIPAPQSQVSKEGTSVTDSGSGPKSSADGPATEATKPPKAPRARAPRPAKNQSNNSSQNATVDEAAASPSEAPARRSRPVIGLASRQFEAALSGVGGRERRKRERGKEKESPAPEGNDNGPSSEAAPASSSVAVPIPPKHGGSATGSDEVEPRPSSSPKKERTRRGGRGGGGAGGASGGAPPVKISGILQRADIAPTPPAAIEQGEGLVNTNGNPTSGNRGGGRRGRGRGGHST